MGLPSPDMLAELARLIAFENHRSRQGLEAQLRDMARPGYTPPPPTVRSFADKAADKGTHWAKKGVEIGLSKGASGAASHIVHSGLTYGPSVNMVGHVLPAIGPLGAALTAWIGMATVAVQASKVFDLYALRDDARSARKGPTRYSCTCALCAANIQYIIDKKERNVGLVAVAVGTVGVSGLFKAIHSAGKKIKSKLFRETRPKEKTCREMVASAKGGCLAAMATIFLLSGKWTQGYRDSKTMTAAVETIMAEDGWDRFKDCF
ncbi:hypothetical protein [Aquabacter spiritensis]|uniref:Uncharacterized protein n=1 Tax=Aquabacter spiritensis TaxID=933073 RepID=A0A4R3LZK6_9HYPH|nr:hypothetical protein [Aquabacter spiritensis]TCT04225.1 hypothetical protein EDC64_10741 [Aquabacter spiritensis]